MLNRMRKFFAPNISASGRVVRATFGVLLLAAGATLAALGHLTALILIAAGLVSLFEAVRGWCIMRAVQY